MKELFAKHKDLIGKWLFRIIIGIGLLLTGYSANEVIPTDKDMAIAEKVVEKTGLKKEEPKTVDLKSEMPLEEK
jgi:hypothetical protein